MEKINPKYPDALLHGFNKLREQNQLCDVIINAGEHTFHAHKAVLAATSSYFAAMFTSGFKESSENEIKIDCNSKAVGVLLQFVYTGRFDGSQIMDCLFDVLELSCYTESIEFSLTCSEFIADLLESEQLPEEISLVDICKMAFLARNHDHLSELVKASDVHLENNLQRLKFSDVFLQNASAKFLQEFLGRDSVFCNMDEKQVLELTITWLKHSWEDRCNHSLQLLQKIRLGLIPSEDLKELIGPEVHEIPGCSELVNDVLKLQTSETSKSELSLKKPEFFETRGMTRAQTSEQETGQKGSSGNSTNFKLSDYFDSFRVKITNYQFINSQDENKYWINQPTIENHYQLNAYGLPNDPVRNYGILEVGKKLYVAGGTAENVCGRYNSNNDFYCYEPAEDKWLQLPSMKLDRHSAEMVHLDGFIYVIGGIRDRGEGCRINNMERYDIINKIWKIFRLLPEKDEDDDEDEDNDEDKDDDEDEENSDYTYEDTFKHISATVFKGKIIVYGVLSKVKSDHYFREYDSDDSNSDKNNHDKHNPVIMIFYPDKDHNDHHWKVLHEDGQSSHRMQPMLLKHRGRCYKILYTPEEQAGLLSSCHAPSVQALDIKADSNGTYSVILEKLEQSDLPYGAFRINNEAFMIKKGIAYKTDAKIGPL